MSLELVQERTDEAVRVTRSLSKSPTSHLTLAIAEAISESLRNGGKVLLCGNGGSSADAQHLAAELLGRFVLDRRPLPAICLTDNMAAVTAIANDYGYVDVMARAVGALGTPGDVIIGMSASAAGPPPTLWGHLAFVGKLGAGFWLWV